MQLPVADILLISGADLRLFQYLVVIDVHAVSNSLTSGADIFGFGITIVPLFNNTSRNKVPSGFCPILLQ